MKIIKQGVQNGHIAHCNYCNSDIMYWDNEVEKTYIDYNNIDIHYTENCINCPVCKNKIYL